jgi:hypothetical protein
LSIQGASRGGGMHAQSRLRIQRNLQPRGVQEKERVNENYAEKDR